MNTLVLHWRLPSGLVAEAVKEGVRVVRVAERKDPEAYSVTVPLDDYLAWHQTDDSGRRWAHLIQDVLPGLSAEQREFLISGLTPEDWDDKLGEEP